MDSVRLNVEWDNLMFRCQESGDEISSLNGDVLIDYICLEVKNQCVLRKCMHFPKFWITVQIKRNLSFSTLLVSSLFKLIFPNGVLITSARTTKQFESSQQEMQFEVAFTKPEDLTLESLRIRGHVIISNAICTSNPLSRCIKRDSLKEFKKNLRVFKAESFCQLSEDLSRCTSSLSIFSDIKLICESVVIPVHKVILSTRSQAFADMFRIDTSENLESIVHINDLNLSVLSSLLRYIYVGKLDELTYSLARDLLHAADKYQIPHLKRICSDYLQSNISADNVFDILIIGNLHNSKLRTYAVEFMAKSNLLALLEKDEWKSLHDRESDLVIDVLIELINILRRH